jgi:hypothetical protein
MEPDSRAETDKTGFCPVHMKKLYDYGNALGNALILQTHYAGLLESFRAEMETFTAPKRGLFGKKAASVLPPAVDALMMTSQSLLNTTGIELSWISRKDVQPCFHIHLCMDSWSNSNEEELRLI